MSFLVFSLFCTVFSTVYGFNVDTRTATLYKGPAGSMFGFAVALHQDKNGIWTLVGAPKAQTRQPNVTEGGAVYKCKVDTPTGCRQIPFDRTGPNFQFIENENLQTDEKSNQWFGATVDSSIENGIVVSCAPRYVYFSINLQRREPIGTCWIGRNSLESFEEYSPCRNQSTWGFHRQGYCQAGMSAAITEAGQRLFVGAVGSWYWQGQVFSKNLVSDEEEYSSSESPASDDDSFLGYSSAVGEFTGDKIMDVVVGMPRGNNLTGKVVLFNATLHNLHNITGEQLGSYFGYSLCVSDVNGDGLDDIVIGAPLYTNFQSKESRYEEGRVYVIYQTAEHSFDSKSFLDGEYSKGRFGLALASLKDINQDGFEDFAVGAPYAGKEGKGIVYIFHGSPLGIRDKPSQVITPEDFNEPALSTLGFSVTGGLDMDNNDYPDIAIGAYDSDRAIFMRSRPVVNITSHIKLKDVISLEDKDCVLKDKTKVTCLKAVVCMSYNGLGVAPELDILYNFTLDASQKSSRAMFLAHNISQVQNITRLRKNVSYCNSSEIYIQNGIRDKLSPIIVKVEYDLVDLEPYRYVLKPVLNHNVPTYVSKQINIEKNCGTDDVCVPDLQLIAGANMHQYSIGSTKQLKLDVLIHNAKEDAFEAMLYVSMPLDVSYVNIDRSKLDFPVSCSGAQPEITGVNELICDIGNPLPANKTLDFKIILAPSRIVSSIKNLEFVLMANSTNDESVDTLYDNEEVIELPVRVEVAVAVHGISQPEIITYNKSQELPKQKIEETDLGDEVTHIYELGNRGPSSIREAEVYILWPTYTLDRKPLLYMMAQPEVRGNGRCETVPDVNPLQLKEVRRKPRNENYVSVREMKKYSLLDEIQANQYKKNRRKREFFSDESEEKYFREDDDSFAEELSCGPTLCTRIRCTITNLEKHEHVLFSIRSRLWKETYDEFGVAEVQTSSKLLARITALPYGVDPIYLPYKVFSVTTKIILEDERFQPYIIPWWIIILAICCGLLLLGLLALLLWKLGFFKRKRPQEQPEKEPLNERNGYRMTSGDAAL